MNDNLGRSVEFELRQDIKEINEKVTNLQVSLNKEMAQIQGSLKILKSKQNMGAWIFKSLLTIVAASISWLLGAHFSK